MTSIRPITPFRMTALLLGIVLPALLHAPGPASAQVKDADPVTAAAERVETTLGMRVGFAVIDTGTGAMHGYRAGERFTMASTFKALACAAALSSGDPVLEKKHKIRQADLRPHSPVTEKRVGTSLSTRALCEITLRTSDNAAANTVLKAIGGPPALTDFLRRTGDDTTRLDRYEPELNQATPGDPRDTTTPQAMASTLRRLLLDGALEPEAADQLESWMAANAVAGGLLRAELPKGWRIADRSGAGGHGTRGVIALLRPPEGAPLVVAIYMDGRKHPLKTRDAAIAEIGAAIFAEYGQ
ncbi:class A beta-lactamase (plasmid) [Rhizobium sp. SSM4.3]|uniref:beta-lactamase n=2 Tax=Peteryoungia algae TaxID=2919917 RepID=A0ABT0D4P9_9HYPH|nr:class A beta-lactamase [Rhizobium sp. SSM4.3]MCJ8240388.1 class A beta-lactamase [Rhizobium sp. SSM4.3]